MGKFYDDIPESHFKWIQKQHMFWVATAPLSAQGHVNLSPKGMANSFHVVNSKQVWYEDLTGSGVETISHIRENGRITIMFCAFEGPPRILRLFGTGTIHEYGSPEYDRLIPATSRKPGSRAAIVVDLYRVGSSCGYAVPLYDFVVHRTQLLHWAINVENGDRALATAHDSATVEDVAGDKASNPERTLRSYWQFANMRSLDGLPGLLTAPDAILDLTPQSNFDKDSPKPMMRRTQPAEVSITARDRKWFAAGLILGAGTVYAVTTLAASLKETHPHFL